jgi:hypothetical protein
MAKLRLLQPMEPGMETLIALEAARSAHPNPPLPGSPGEAEALARFARFFESFSPDRIERLLAETYAADVYFNDTLKTVRGVEPLAHYLRDSAEAVEACRVEVLATTRTAEGDHLLRWRMAIRFKRFRRGIDTETVGLSHLRFDAEGRVVYQQDYWNAADGLYEHIPLLGSLIRMIKRRL